LGKANLQTNNRPRPAPVGVTTDGANRSRAHPTADDDIFPPNNFTSCMHSTNSTSEASEMKFDVRIGKLTRQIEIQRNGPNQFAIVPDDRARLDTKLVDRKIDDTKIDAVEVAPNTYSILVNGRAFEAIVIPAAEGVLVRCAGREVHAIVSDPRAWRGGRGTLFGAEGKQKVTAPMPGKVVRVLVSAGDTVEANQGLVVVEAMKMQNEIRAPKAGTIERIFISEGQAVAAGEALVTIN
jgi:biotin carboxyl carrier protein